MSIHYHDQHTMEDASRAIADQATIAQPVSPPTPPPQPPQGPPHGKRERRFIVSVLLAVLVLVLVVGSFFAVQLAGRPSSQATPTPTAAVTHTPAPKTTTPSPTTPAPTVTATPTPTPPVSTSQPINAIWMSDATTGWARTTTHLILRTTDGGQSWQDVTPPYSVSSLGQFPPAFASLNGSNAWVTVSEKLPDGSMAGVVYRTSNGGHSWQQATLSMNQLGVSQVQFVNARDGWVLSSPGGGAAGSEPVNLYRTTDGGQTWLLVARAPGALPQPGIKSGMGWISATTGWITGSIAIPNTVYLYWTQDGGLTWQPQSLPSSSPIQATLPPVFFRASEGLLPVTLSTSQGPAFAVYATHDAGATWSSSTPLATMTGSWDLLTMQQWWVVGANGATLTETSNGGQHWTAITPGANFQHISQLDFVSAQEGWAVSTPPTGAPLLLKTLDGGQTWAPASSGPQAASWMVFPSPNLGTNFAQLNGLAAVSAGDIWAVGYASKGGILEQTLIEEWNGTSWQVVASPSPGNFVNNLVGASALSASDIWAVGYDSNAGGASQSLIEHWNGSTWQVVASPNVGTGPNSLSGIAALSASDIWAVGSSYSTTTQTLIEHWNGTSWHVFTSPTVNGFLTGVAALSPTDVWAVGYYSNGSTPFQTLVEHWNGSIWQVVASPSAGTGNNFLSGVVALNPTDIWAVGYVQNSAITSSSTLIEHWNGTTWQIVASPNIGMYNYLTDVTATSATNVWAVGYCASNVSNRPSLTLTEHWNGTGWQVVASPNAGTAQNILRGITALSSTNMWAVGQYEGSQGSPIQTLIERWTIPAYQTLTVLSVDLTVSPSSIVGITCGSTMMLLYTVTFHLQATAAGGTIQFLYTWNNGRASLSGSVTVPPDGPNTVTFTYTATGRVGGAYAFPGVAQVNVTSPNTVQSPQVLVSGACTTAARPSADSAPVLVPGSGTTYAAWTSMNADHNLALATYDTATKTFGSPTVLTDTTLAGAGPSLEDFNGHLYMAWLGTDGHLDVARFNPADPTHLAGKVTLSDTSTNAPSMVVFNSRLYLAWRGTDGNLNLISSADGSTFDAKVTYNIAIRTSPTVGAADNALFVAWEDTSANSSITIGRADLSNPANLNVVVTTASSLLPVGLASVGVPAPFIEVAWRTPADTSIHLGAFEGAQAMRNVVTTTQTTLYGPALANLGGTRYLCWTGTGGAQTVNVIPLSI